MLGTVQRPLSEGFHVVSPFARVYHVELREQQNEDSLGVIANNGPDIKLRSSILHQSRPRPSHSLRRQAPTTTRH